MKKAAKRLLLSATLVLLLALILAFAIPRAVSFLMQDRYAKEALSLSNILYGLMPEIEQGFPDDRINMGMPSREIDGKNFSLVIDVPLYGASLPVCTGWNKGKSLNLYPCIYKGSMYDGSLIIGGSDAKGQFDFARIITGGDRIFLTDMTGLRYSYTVTDIERVKGIASLKDADLILFTKNSYSFDYTVIYCNIGN